MKNLTQFIHEALDHQCAAIYKKIKDAINVLPKTGVCFLIQASGSMHAIKNGCASELDKLFNENGYDIYSWNESYHKKLSSVNDLNPVGPHIHLDVCIKLIKELSKKYKCICVLGDSNFKFDKVVEDNLRQLAEDMNKNLYWFFTDNACNDKSNEFAKMLNKTINCA